MRTESPAIPADCAAGSRLDIETVMRFGFKMMRKVLFDHLLSQFACRHTKTAACPKVLPSIASLHVGKFFKYLSGSPPVHPSHDGRWSDMGRSGHQNVDMIFTYHFSKNLNLIPFTRGGQVHELGGQGRPPQYVVTIFRGSSSFGVDLMYIGIKSTPNDGRRS
jgi:hypothetical protein